MHWSISLICYPVAVSLRWVREEPSPAYRRIQATLVASFAAAFAGSVNSEVLPLDISSAYNYDAYISMEEADHALLYDPPEAWGFVSREVGRVFGQHSSGTWVTYAWDDQAATGLPVSGEILTDYGLFKLSTERSRLPPSGYSLLPQGQTQSLPVQPNVMRAHRPLSELQNTPLVSVTAVLPIGQQQRYETINFLVSGSNRKAIIYANYDDRRGGFERTKIYETPGDPQTESETGFPFPHDSRPSNPHLVPAFSMNDRWESYEGTSRIAKDETNIWTFSQPLLLDPDRVLRGFTLSIYDEDQWKNRTAIIYAASADRIDAPVLSSAIKRGSISEGGTSVVSTYNGLVRKVDANDQELWSQSLGLVAAGPIISPEGNTYIGTIDGNLHRLTSAGDVSWSTKLTGLLSGLILDRFENQILAISKSGVLTAVSLDGDVLWRLDLGFADGAVATSAPVVPPTTAQSQLIFVTDSSANLHAVERPRLDNGMEARVLWVR